jgi:hypothetical protein
MKLRSFLIAGLSLSLAATELRAGIIFDEQLDAPGGQFSQFGANPTDIPTLMVGNNDISGIVGGSGSPSLMPLDYDHFNIVVPAGTQLTGVYLERYANGDDYAFMAIDIGATFPYDFLTGGADTSLFIGGTLLGPNGFQFVEPLPPNPPFPRRNLMFQPDDGDPNTPLEPGIGGGFAGTQIGTFTSLPANTYSILVQQSADDTEYTLRFEITAVPEPTSAILLTFGIGLMAARRRRR